MTPAVPDRLPLYRAKIAHLDTLIADLDRDWERLPRLFATSVLALPVGIMYGFVWAFVAIVLSASFVGVVAYITGMRKREYTDEREALLREIAAAEGRASRLAAQSMDERPALG